MIKEKLQDQIKSAMREKNQHLLVTLRGLHAAIKQIEIDTREEVSEEGCIAIVQKEVKKRRDTIKFAEDAGRQDMIDQNNQEIAILQGFLGEQLSEDKLRELISGLIAGGADNLGKIMGGLNKDHKGKFEGKVASEIAKQLLG